MNTYAVLTETSPRYLGLILSTVLGLRKGRSPFWRPRLVPDPDKKEAVVLEMFSDQEAGVMRSLLSHYPSKSAPDYMLMVFALAVISCRRRHHPSRSRIIASAHDFAPKTCFANISRQTQSMTVVRITYGQLCSFLHEAETRDEAKQAQRGVPSALAPNCRKRCWEITPPQALSPGKEAEIAKREAEEAAKSEAQDSLWR